MNVERYHPEIRAVREKWKRIRILLEELEEKYESFMITLPGESTVARNERLESFVAGFFNFAGYLAVSKGDAVYNREIQRTNLTEFQQAFEKQADKSGQTFQEMLHNEAAPILSAYGTIFGVLDKAAEVAPNLDTELKTSVPYLTLLSPFQAVDFEYSKEDGELLWFQYTVDMPVDRSDPFAAKRGGTGKAGIATWTRTEFTIKNEGLKTDLIVPIPNTFGFVPVIIQGQFVEPNKTIGKSSFFASSRYIIMGNNLESASNSEVFKNAMATLLLHIQDWDDDVVEKERNPDDNLKVLKVQASDQKNMLLYSNPDAKPEYLARDLDLIGMAAGRGETYFDRALENEKSALSVQSLKAPQSGVSKGYDFVEVNNALTAFSSAMEGFHKQTLAMVARMTSEPVDKFSVVYPDRFDTRDFNARLAFLKGLIDARYPSKLGMREAYKTVTAEITQKKDVAEAIDAELDTTEMPDTNPPPPAPIQKPKTAPAGAKE